MRLATTTPAPVAAAPPRQQPSGNDAWDWRTVLPAFDAIEKRIGRSTFLGLLGIEGYEMVDLLPNRDEARRVYLAVLNAAQDLPNMQPSAATSPAPAPAPAPPRGQVVQMPPAAAPRPAQPAPQPATQPVQGMPAAVEAMWKRMSNIKGVCEVFAELKADLIELTGEERALNTYACILAQHGAAHSNEFRNLGKARQCASALYERIQAVQNPPAPHPDVTDDDVPSGDSPEEPTLFEHTPLAKYGVN